MNRQKVMLVPTLVLVFAVALSLGLNYANGTNQIQLGIQNASTQQSLNPSYTYNASYSISQSTPFSFVNGYRVYRLGSRPMQDFSNIVSPCGSASSGRAYTPGIYNCQPSFASRGTLSSSSKGQSQIESLNWAGYVGTETSPVTTSVQGSWIVQAAGAGSASSYSAQWTGIGGFNDDTLIQSGTESDYYNGAAHYYAWYELLPAYETQIGNFPVSPGDKIYVDITAIPGKVNGWTIILIDITTGEGFTINVTYSSSQLSSEWVDERPEICSVSTCSLSTLANFGTSYYGYDYTGNSLTNYANMGSGPEPVSQLPGLTSVTMVSQSGTTLAQPYPLSADGTSFSMSYGQLKSQTYSLSVSASPSSGGTVSPSGTNNYAAGTQITISETPSTGYTFTGWSGTGTGSYTGSSSSEAITINANIIEVANFQAASAAQYTLTVNNNGCTSVSGAGTYSAGSTATFSVVVPAGYTFKGWTGSGTGSYTGTSTSSSVVMNNNIIETATCTAPSASYTLTMSASPSTYGTVSPGSGTYAAGSKVTISEKPTFSFVTFTGWTCTGAGCYSGTSPTATITINNAITETANYKLSFGGFG